MGEEESLCSHLLLYFSIIHINKEHIGLMPGAKNPALWGTTAHSQYRTTRMLEVKLQEVLSQGTAVCEVSFLTSILKLGWTPTLQIYLTMQGDFLSPG